MTIHHLPVDPPGRAEGPLLRLSAVGKTYPSGTVALESIDLAVDRGEFLCLVGPSGCGKSTLLRLIAGLSDASSGAIAWSDPATAGDLGFVFQDPTLMPWSRVWDNVWLPLRLRGISRGEARPAIDAALERVGLTDFVRAYPRQLSGGMRMRVAIARALVTRPRLLLLDEPFAALDEITRFRLNDDLLRLWDDQALTVLFVTHSVYESAYLAERVVVMAPRPGRVVHQVAIDGPRPRDESFRRAASYADACQAISAALRDATDARE